MKVFAINVQNNVTANTWTRQARRTLKCEVFTRHTALAALTAQGPASRLVEI